MKFSTTDKISIAVLFISLFTWIINNIFELKADYGSANSSLVDIKEGVKSIDERTRNIEKDVAAMKAVQFKGAK